MSKIFKKKYLFLITIIVVIQVIVVSFNIADWDLWARLAVGKIFSQTGHVLKNDIFAYTPTKLVWIDHEWGAGVIFYNLVHFFGDYGLNILKFLIIFGIFLSVYMTNQLRSNNDNPYRITYYLAFIYLLAQAFNTTLRAQSFTYLFFALWLYLLDLVRKGNKRLIWTFPLIMIIWVNVHGGFLAGLGIVLLYGIGEAINRRDYIPYCKILALSGLATFINPYGLKYWGFIIDAVTMTRPYVGEWDPINLFGPVNEYLSLKILIVFILLSFIYLFLKQYKQVNYAEVLILLATFYLTLEHRRHMTFLIIAAGSYIYYYLYPAINWYTRGLISRFYSLFPIKFCLVGRHLREITVYGLILAIGLLIITFIPNKVKVDDDMFPTKAVSFIKINHLSGNLLVLFNWGSYAMWKLYPQCLIAIDGRYEEVYPQEVVEDVSRFHYIGANWNGLIKKYHTDIIMIPIIYDAYTKLLFMDEWKLVYKDNTAAIFIPRNKDKGKWIMPGPYFNLDKEKYDSDITFLPENKQ